MRPRDIQQINEFLAVVWDDGHESVLPRTLRDASIYFSPIPDTLSYLACGMHCGRVKRLMRAAKKKESSLGGRRFNRLAHFSTIPLRLLARPVIKRTGQTPSFIPD